MSAPARVAAARRLIAAVAVIAVIAGIPVMGMPPVAAPGVLTPFVAAPPFAPLAVMTPAILLGLGWSGSRQRRNDAKSGEGCDSLTHGFSSIEYVYSYNTQPFRFVSPRKPALNLTASMIGRPLVRGDP